MEDLELYLSIAATIFGLLVSTLTFLTKFIKCAKAKRIAEELLQITQDIIPFIEEAEKFIHYTGKEKKAYVMTKATQLVINNKMKVNQEKISSTIDELVSLTKQVNIANLSSLGNISSQKELQRLHV